MPSTPRVPLQIEHNPRMYETADLNFLLFVPADRPERLAKALGAGADAVVIDLEDAVAGDRKRIGRDALISAAAMIASAPVPAIVRINATDAETHEADCRAVAELRLAAVMLPKVESPEAVTRAQRMTGHQIWALVESARGLAVARSVAPCAARLAFGSIDFAADLGSAHSREALLAARSEIVLASRLAGLASPIDGVTTAILDHDQTRADAAYAAALGFAGKLLIHPSQIAPAREGFRPSDEEIAWAERVLAAQGGAVAIGGTMVDAPVRRRAQQIRRRASMSQHAD